MLHGESTNGRCSMEQAKGMRALSEGCAAFLGMVPRGRLCKMWHVNKDLKEVRRLPMWRYRTEVSCCEDIQNQDSKAAICLIYVRHSKEAGIWGRTLTGGSRISDWRVKQATVAHRQLFWVRWGPLKVTEQRGGMITWWKETGERELAKVRDNGSTGQPGSREGHGGIN